MDPETKTATRDLNRVCPKGQEMGSQMARLTEPEVRKLIRDGEWERDERCASCAFRPGTVPNGCIQTQLDALKCLLEKQAFLCHCTEAIGDKVCAGWFAATQALKGKPKLDCPWPFSTPDGGYDEEELEKSTKAMRASREIMVSTPLGGPDTFARNFIESSSLTVQASQYLPAGEWPDKFEINIDDQAFFITPDLEAAKTLIARVIEMIQAKGYQVFTVRRHYGLQHSIQATRNPRLTEGNKP